MHRVAIRFTNGGFMVVECEKIDIYYHGIHLHRCNVFGTDARMLFIFSPSVVESIQVYPIIKF